MKSYSGRLVIMSAILLAIQVVVFYLLNIQLSLVYFIAYVYLIGFNLVAHHYLVKANNERPQKFINTFIAVLGLKMFMSLLLVLVLGLSFKDELLPLVISFLILYFCYTIFEIKSLLKLPKEKSNKDS